MKRPSSWIGVVLLLASASVATGALASTAASLVPATGLPPWPETPYRWRDVAAHPYALSYRDGYAYDSAAVTLTFEAAGESTFAGHLSASNLKPNFAYQMKLAGKPEDIWGGEGDDATNERLGYAGRWWRVQPNPGNSNDSDYEAHKDDPGYIYEGYLLFGFFVTDRLGSAEVDFRLSSSYHVLWWEHQRSPGVCDSPVDTVVVEGYTSDPAYGGDVGPVEVGVYAEIERLCHGGTTLPAGFYHCRFLLTEESFHQSGPPDLGWVGVSGNHFTKNGGPFYYAGANCYYLMAYSAGDEGNEESLRGYVDEVLGEAKELGLTVVRTWAFNDGADEWNALQTAPGVYDERVFRGLDYVLHKASEVGVHLVLPLVNNWDDYGGMNQYVQWSTTASSHDDFYTDADCRQWYKDHVSAVLNRVNTFNGRTYKDDPTVLAWELANEPDTPSDNTGDILQAWIEEMSAYVKSVDPKHLVTTGSIGYDGWHGVDFVRNHQPADIDFACLHAWPDHFGQGYTAIMDQVAGLLDDAEDILGKPAILEEFGKYQPLSTRDQYYQGWYDTVYARAAVGEASGGSNFWILYHDDYTDYDGFGVYYPSHASTVTIITTEAAKMRALCDPYAGEGGWLSVLVCDTVSFHLGGPGAPVVTDVQVENLTLSHTDEYAKDGDDLGLSARVTGDPSLEASDIVANFSALLDEGGGAVPAETYDGTTAEWITVLEDVTLTADGSKMVVVTATGDSGVGSGSDQITADNTAPEALGGFAAAPGHESVSLNWDDPTGTDVNYRGVLIRYNVTDGYPEYETPGSYPSGPTDGSGVASFDDPFDRPDSPTLGNDWTEEEPSGGFASIADKTMVLLGGSSLHTWAYHDLDITSPDFTVICKTKANAPPTGRGSRMELWCDRGGASEAWIRFFNTNAPSDGAGLSTSGGASSKIGTVAPLDSYFFMKLEVLSGIASGKIWHEGEAEPDAPQVQVDLAAAEMSGFLPDEIGFIGWNTGVTSWVDFVTVEEAFGLGGTCSGEHVIAARDIYSYTAFAYDQALNYGPAEASAQGRSTNYLLGDVDASDGPGGGDYDGDVDVFDISALSSAYWLTPLVWPENECDVGPTEDGTGWTPPEPDGSVDFEDLMVFSLNYGSGAGKEAWRPVVLAMGTGGGRTGVGIRESGGQAPGGDLCASLVLEGNTSEVKGLSLVLRYDPAVVEITDVEPAAELRGSPAALFFQSDRSLPGEVRLDIAVLGEGRAIHGTGEIALVYSRPVGKGDRSVRLHRVEVRGMRNEVLFSSVGEASVRSEGSAPGATSLVGAWPNPFNPSTAVHYQLQSDQHVVLRVFDPAGRLVRTLVDERKKAGSHSAVWDGRDGRGALVGSGAYFVRMRAGAYASTNKVVLLQ